jgi:8-oxo-dGTP diphosphatase
MPRPVTPLIAADIIIRLRDRPRQLVVLIERQFAPHGWALPGGFVDVGESLEAAAIREAREETRLDVKLEALLGCYSDPTRDHRGHTVSAVYVATASGEPRASDDAKDIMLMDARDKATQLAFDHRRILDDYIEFLESGRPAPLRI